MKVALWQLADDPEEYEEYAGKWILVTPNGEEEPYYPPRDPLLAQEYEDCIFDTPDEAREFAEACGDEVVQLEINDG